jgi:hypothetical protein
VTRLSEIIPGNVSGDVFMACARYIHNYSGF